MKLMYALMAFALVACNQTAEQTQTAHQADAPIVTQPAEQPQSDNLASTDTATEAKTEPSESQKTYANERFKNVTVEETGADTYKIKGKGQIFEANFGWVVEDGHNELKKGFEMTDAGAPEWGNFEFTINVKKDRPNSTLTLILFESSAKDGSRVHQLPIPLP